MRRTRRPARPEPSIATRRYFTDGGRLYLLVEWIVRTRDSMLAVVEDCGSLEILIVRADQLDAWREVASAGR
jgi:hypothetical protein